MHLSAADKPNCRRLPLMLSPITASLPRAASALYLQRATSQRFLNTMPELLRKKNNKKVWQWEQTQRGHFKNYTQAAIYCTHGKAQPVWCCKPKKAKRSETRRYKCGASCLLPPPWTGWHDPKLLLWLKPRLAFGSQVACCLLFPDSWSIWYKTTEDMAE